MAGSQLGVLAERSKELTALFERGQFRDFHDQLQGDLHKAGLELQLLAARALSHLGLQRDADAALLRLWRKHQDPSLVADYLSTVAARKGSLAAWRLLPELAPLVEEHTQLQSQLLLEKSELLNQFRDFAAAESCLAQAMALDAGPRPRMAMIRCKYQQDDYETALELCEALLQEHPGYRPAIQMRAQLRQLNNDYATAIDSLQMLWGSCQAVGVGYQLFHLLVETQAFEAARNCLARLESLLPAQPAYVVAQLNAMQADLLCAQQRYHEAIPFLEQKSFFYKSVSESIQRSSQVAEQRVLDVPFIRQRNMTCAPASLAAVSQYWGTAVEQDVIAEAICYGGTQAVDERRWAEEQGWHVEEFQLAYAPLKQLIDSGIPVLLATVEPGLGHLQIIVGYDEAMGVYILRDPSYPRLQKLLVEGAHEYYASSGPRCMLMLPADKRGLLENCELPQRQLYEHYYLLQRALENNDRREAAAQFAQLKQMDAQHRLTISARRMVAFYDQDEAFALRCTEALLKRYPEDVNLQLSKANSLEAMGSTQALLDYLETVNQQANCHILLRSRLVDVLRRDHRQMPRVARLFDEIFKRMGLHAPTLYAYAGLLWDQGEFERSFELYRFATCLDDTNEAFAQSYFKAARFHKQTEQAISFLEERFQRFGQLSAGPAQSLYFALNALERNREALDLLDRALGKRPQDGRLLLFAAEKFLYARQTAKAKALIRRARTQVNPLRYYEAAADLYEFEQDRQRALACWQKVLQREPLNWRANHSITRLLLEMGRNQASQDFIAQRLEQYPGNYSLLRIQIEWADPDDYRQLLNSYEQVIQHHPDDVWARQGKAGVLLRTQRLDEALATATEALAIEQNNSRTLTLLGDIHAARQEQQAARDCYRRAIAISCDATAAYEPLLRTSIDHKSQREELAFIHQQLMTQVTFGDGVLEYQSIAQRWLPAEELINFLKAAVSERPDLWQSWVALALALRESGANEPALEILDRARRRFPLLPRVLLERAETLRVLQRLDAAEEQLKEVLALSPGWSRASNMLCELLERQNRFQEAIAQQQLVIQHNPLSAVSYGYLADLYKQQGEEDKAIAAMEKAVAISPRYGWAWHRLYNWSNAGPQQQAVLDKLARLYETLHRDPEVLRIYTSLVPDAEQAGQLLADFLATQPQDLNICSDYINLLCEQERYTEALHYCSEEYWKGKRPSQIVAREAWVHARKHDLLTAIAIMEGVVREEANYYDGWRLLANWYELKGDRELCLRAVEHCQRLAPNDPQALCFVAEKLQALEADPPRIADLLERAFQLDTSDQYTALTWIDHALELGDYEAAERSLQILKRQHDNAFTCYRELQIALHRQEVEAALHHWERLLTSVDVNDWLLSHGWDLLKSHKLEARGLATIKSLRAQGRPICAEAGGCEADWELQHCGLKAMEKTLRKMQSPDDFQCRYLESYLRELIRLRRPMPAPLRRHLQASLQADTQNWGLMGYLLSELRKPAEVSNWMHHYRDKADAKAWMLYFYAVSLRQLGRWDEAVHVTRDAFEKETDQYRDDIVIWYALDGLLQGGEVPREELALVNRGNLAGLSQYPLALCDALLTLGSRDLISGFAELAPKLRACQRAIQSNPGDVALVGAKRRTRAWLSARIHGSLAQRLFWRWRLGNHF